jgi:hypothetical protein
MRMGRAFRTRFAPRTPSLGKELILQPIRQFDASVRAVISSHGAPSRPAPFIGLPDPELPSERIRHEADLHLDRIRPLQVRDNVLHPGRDLSRLVLACHSNSLRRWAQHRSSSVALIEVSLAEQNCAALNVR